MIADLLQDLRFGLRTLRKSPGFTAVAVLSLALGIGANTAIFTLIDAVMLKTLPVRSPEQLVFLSDPASAGVSIGIQNGVRSLFTYEEFERVRDSQQVFSGMFASESGLPRVQVAIGGAPPEEARARLVSGDYFGVQGVDAVLGRTFTAAGETGPGSNPVTVISYGYWKRKFGLSPSVLGMGIQVNGVPLTIVGVTPPKFFGESVGDTPDFWIPMMMQPQIKRGRFWLRDDASKAEKVMWLHVMGRLKPGVTREQAEANVNLVFRQLLAARAGSSPTPERKREIMDQKIKLQDGSRGASVWREELSRPLLVLMSVVALVLLIACANIANLLLARAAARRKEIGIRLAIGARRFRLLRQLLTESMLLSFIGAAIGVMFAYWGSGLLTRQVMAGPNPLQLDVAPDGRILAFTAAVAVLTGLLFGLAPALRATGVDVGSTLRESSRGLTGSAARLSFGKALVASQVAISLLLLIGAGLFLRTLRNLRNVDLGYSGEKLLLVRVDAVAAGYKGIGIAGVYRQLLDRFRAIPGVRAVAASENGLFSGTESGDRITVEGYTPKKEGDDSARFDQVGPNYFSMLGIPITLGREIGPEDNETAAPVCVINEAMARFYFAGLNPIGMHITDEFPDTRKTFRIVGVARDARDHRLRGDIPRRFYIPLFNPLGDYPPSVYFELRTFADPAAVMNAVRREIQAVDRALPIVSMRTLDELLDRTTQQERLIAQLSTFFGALALVLASIGLYGVLSYAVGRRTNEIGIRMALGARPGAVIWLFLRESLVLIALGCAVGLGAALAATRLVASSLFGVKPEDPATLAAATALIAAIALLAGYLPARRAASVDPVTSLRCE